MSKVTSLFIEVTQYGAGYPVLFDGEFKPPTSTELSSFESFWPRQDGEEETQVKAAILIIGEDGVLSYTRAQILKDCWETATAKDADAEVALHARSYDLLVFSQTVPDGVVKEIMASAVKLHPEVKFLLISEEGRQRPFGCATFTSELFKPDRLHRKVAGLLEEKTAKPSVQMNLFIEAMVQESNLNS